MASIHERNGVFRVRFRKKGHHFSISFASKEEAEDWILKHEDNFYEDPEKYHKWFKDLWRVGRYIKKRDPKWLKKLKEKK